MALSLAQVEHLRRLEGKNVRLRFNDGELVVGEVIYIDLEYNDVVYDLLETDRPEKYPTDRPWKHTAHAASFESIVSFELANEAGGN